MWSNILQHLGQQLLERNGEQIIEEWSCREGKRFRAQSPHLTLTTCPECSSQGSIVNSQASPQLSASLWPPDLMVLPILTPACALSIWKTRACTAMLTTLLPLFKQLLESKDVSVLGSASQTHEAYSAPRAKNHTKA